MADEAPEQELKTIETMIDASAQRLEGLRTQCATGSELTQQEIRTLEGKLIKLFANQLITKLKLRNGCDEPLPSLKKWLQVVGLSRSAVQGVCQDVASIEELQDKTEKDLTALLSGRGVRPEELSRLCRALASLNSYTEILRQGKNDNSDSTHLYWDSWDRPHALKPGPSPRTGRSRSARASVPSEDSLSANNNNNNRGGAIPASSSVSSINSLNTQCVPRPPLTPPPQFRGKGMKFPTTPPPRRKQRIAGTPVLLTDLFPLKKSVSHESQLSKENDGEKPAPGGRARLPTEPGPDTTSPVLASPLKSPPYNSAGTDSDDNSCKSASSLQVPKSPRTSTPVVRNMTHQINHRFIEVFKMMATCDYCSKLIYLHNCVRCKHCKYTCHRFCEDKVAPSCGLPPELLNVFKKKCDEQQMPTNRTWHTNPNPKNKHNFYERQRKKSHPPSIIHITQYPIQYESGSSSGNSSTPSSPAVQSIPTPHSSHKEQFNFLDVSEPAPCEVVISTHPIITTTLAEDLVGSQQSNRTVSGSTSTDSDKTPVRVDSLDSQVSDTETIADGHRWPRQNSMSMREWDIPFEELNIDSEPIGTGQFGTVYQVFWHAETAVKVLNTNHLKDETVLEQFKAAVSIIRRARHDNVMLFMGACMQPPKLAIITSLNKGKTLYKHLQIMKDKFDMNTTTNIAQQIVQGMEYLHYKEIVHKDLKTKNIFYENGKIVIADFALFSITKLCYYAHNRQNDCLTIPRGWLYYLAPEIMKKLDSHDPAKELPFTYKTDVYAFGTVFYELLCGEWPFKAQAPEAIIFQVGKGMKQPLANLQVSRDVKDILMRCWAYNENARPKFYQLKDLMVKLPKKRLARSPSHPIHLSRSAESVF